MDPPRCHRLCDFFGTVAAFSVSLLFQFRCFLSFFCRSLFCFQRLFSGPLCGEAFPYGSEKSFLALAGRLCALVLSRRRRLQYLLLCSALIVLRFLTAQGLYFPSVRIACRSGWVGLVSARTPARLSRLPSPRSFCLWGDCSPERVRAISTARLCALPRLHLQPINVVVSDGPCVEILSWGGLRA